MKAFDLVSLHNIIMTLKSWCYDGNILAFIQNFLHNRKFKVNVNASLSTIKDQENGIPQGSAINPTPFIIGINDILKNLQKPVKVRLFADDFIIFTKGKNMTKLLQSEIESLEN